MIKEVSMLTSKKDSNSLEFSSAAQWISLDILKIILWYHWNHLIWIFDEQIFTDYKKAKSNGIVPSEAFSQPWTVMPTNSLEDSKVTSALPIVLTHLICSSLPSWSGMKNHSCVLTLVKARVGSPLPAPFHVYS